MQCRVIPARYHTPLSFGITHQCRICESKTRRQLQRRQCASGASIPAYPTSTFGTVVSNNRNQSRIASFFEGVGSSVGESVVNTGKTIGWAAAHPGEVVHGVGYLATHPDLWGGVAKDFILDQVTDPVAIATNVALIAGTGGAALAAKGVEGGLEAAKIAEGASSAAKAAETAASTARVARAAETTSEVARAAETGADVAGTVGRTSVFRGAVTPAEEVPGALGRLDQIIERTGSVRSMAGLGPSRVTTARAALAERLIPDVEEAGALKQVAYNKLVGGPAKPAVGGRWAEAAWRVRGAERLAKAPSRIKRYATVVDATADPEKFVASKVEDMAADRLREESRKPDFWNPAPPRKPPTSNGGYPGFEEQPMSLPDDSTTNDSNPMSAYGPTAQYSAGRGYRRSWGSGMGVVGSHAEIGGIGVGEDWRSIDRAPVSRGPSIFGEPAPTAKPPVAKRIRSWSNAVKQTTSDSTAGADTTSTSTAATTNGSSPRTASATSTWPRFSPNDGDGHGAN